MYTLNTLREVVCIASFYISEYAEHDSNMQLEIDVDEVFIENAVILINTESSDLDSINISVRQVANIANKYMNLLRDRLVYDDWVRLSSDMKKENELVESIVNNQWGNIIGKRIVYNGKTKVFDKFEHDNIYPPKGRTLDDMLKSNKGIKLLNAEQYLLTIRRMINSIVDYGYKYLR